MSYSHVRLTEADTAHHTDVTSCGFDPCGFSVSVDQGVVVMVTDLLGPFLIK